MKFKILHVTDFHFVSEKDTKYKNVTERIKFHDELRRFLIKEFKGKIDYLLLTGDFGDRCKSWNLEYAKDWLKNLHVDISIPEENIIYCPGNHDLEIDDIPTMQHMARTDHTTGQNYLFSNEYKDAVFHTYKQDIDNAWNPENLPTVYKEFKDVRFIVLNSSWLSQANGTAIGQLESEIVAAIKKDKTALFEKLQMEYGGIFYDRDSMTYEKDKKEKVSFLPGMLNLSENKTQQLGFYKNKKITEALEKLDNKKINILIFHHPETHLHPFERNYIKNLEGSGFYKYLSSKCHLLICGHTHPVESEDINNNYYNFLPNFVGGGAHLNEHGANERPFFYSYDVMESLETTDVLDIRRNIYLFTDNKFYRAGSERENFDKTEINLKAPDFETREEFCKYENTPGLMDSYSILKAKMRCYINDQLSATLRRLDSNFNLHESGKFVKMPKEMKRPDSDVSPKHDDDTRAATLHR